MFITMEGTDGSGKTTQIRLLYDKLIKSGYDVLLTREPGGTSAPLAEAIRELVLSTRYGYVEPIAEALLYAAARAQHVRETIRPALERGVVVLCDRFYDSSIAYQAYGRGLGEETVREINRAAMDGLTPDRTYLLMADEQLARSRQTGVDRIEGEDDGFFQRGRAGYQAISGEERVLTLDAARTPDEIAAGIWADLFPRLRNN